MDALIIDFLTFFIGATGFFAFILSFAELGVRNRRPIHWYSFAMYFALGLLLIVDFINRGDLFAKFPHMAYSSDCIEFFIGALVYPYFSYLIGTYRDDRQILRRFLLLLIPCWINLVLYIPLLSRVSEFKLTHYPIAQLGSDLPLASYYRWINRTETIWIVFCFGLFALDFLVVKKRSLSLRQKPRLKQRVAIAYLLAWVLVTIGILLNNFWGSVRIQRFIIALACLLMLLLYFIFHHAEQRAGSPGTQVSISEASSKASAKYRLSKLQGKPQIELTRQLRDILDDGPTIADPELTLDKVGDLLFLTPAQASELVNTCFGHGFRTELNKRRVELVKARLLEQPEGNILDIAFRCGFNSKAAFNAAFARVEGMSPRQFRDKHRN